MRYRLGNSHTPTADQIEDHYNDAPDPLSGVNENRHLRFRGPMADPPRVVPRHGKWWVLQNSVGTDGPFDDATAAYKWVQCIIDTAPPPPEAGHE